MKKLVLLSLVALFMSAAISVSAQKTTSPTTTSSDKYSEVTLACNMDCGACSDKIKKQLAYTKGVKVVTTDVEKDLVVIKYRNDRTNVDKLIASLGEINYVAKVYTPVTTQPKAVGCGQAKTGCGQSKTGCAGAKSSGCGGATSTTNSVEIKK